MMPWLVASQTVPLVAIAPMVVIWGGKIGLPVWDAVAMITVYLAFFPVTINALRGLTSSTALHHDLLKSWGASKQQPRGPSASQAPSPTCSRAYVWPPPQA